MEGVETCTKFNIYQHNDHIAVEVQSSDTPMSSSTKKDTDTGEKKCLCIFNLFTYYIFKKRKRPFISLGRPSNQCYVKYH